MNCALIFRLGLVAIFFLCPFLSWATKRTDTPFLEEAKPAPSSSLSSTLQLYKIIPPQKSSPPLTLHTPPKLELTSTASFSLAAAPYLFSLVDSSFLPVFSFPYFILPLQNLAFSPHNPALGSSSAETKPPFSFNPLPRRHVSIDLPLSSHADLTSASAAPFFSPFPAAYPPQRETTGPFTTQLNHRDPLRPFLPPPHQFFVFFSPMPLSTLSHHAQPLIPPPSTQPYLLSSFSNLIVTPLSTQRSKRLHTPSPESYPSFFPAFLLSGFFASHRLSFPAFSLNAFLDLAFNPTRRIATHTTKTALPPLLFAPSLAPLQLNFAADQREIFAALPQTETLSPFFPQKLFSYFRAFAPPPCPFTFSNNHVLKIAYLQKPFPKPFLDSPSLPVHSSRLSLFAVSPLSPSFPLTTFPQLDPSPSILSSSYLLFAALPYFHPPHAFFSDLTSLSIYCYNPSTPLFERPRLPTPPSLGPYLARHSRCFFTAHSPGLSSITLPKGLSLPAHLFSIVTTKVFQKNIFSSPPPSFSLASPRLLWAQLPFPSTPSLQLAPPFYLASRSLSPLAASFSPPWLAYPPQCEKGALTSCSLYTASSFSLPLKSPFHSYLCRSVSKPICPRMNSPRAHLTLRDSNLTLPYSPSYVRRSALAALTPKLVAGPCTEAADLTPVAPVLSLKWGQRPPPPRWTIFATTATQKAFALANTFTPFKNHPVTPSPSDLAIPPLFFAHTRPTSSSSRLPLASSPAATPPFSCALFYPLRSSWLLSLDSSSTALRVLPPSLARLSSSSFLDCHFSLPRSEQEGLTLDFGQYRHRNFLALKQLNTVFIPPVGFSSLVLPYTMTTNLSSLFAPIPPFGSCSKKVIQAQRSAYMTTALFAPTHSPFSHKQRSASAYSATRRYRQPGAYLASLPLPGDLQTFSLNNAFETTLRYTKCSHQKGYLFALDIKPNKALAFPAPSHNFIFVVDASGTIKRRRFQAFKEGVSTALHYLKADDSFNILVVDSHAVAFRPAPVSWSKKSAYTARRFLKEKPYRGFYSKDDAFSLLKLASNYFVEDKKNIVVLMTDGHLLGPLKQHSTDFEQLARYTADFSLFATTASNHNNLAMLDLVSTVTGGELMYSSTHAAFPRKLAVLVKNLGQSIASTVCVQAASPLSTEVTFYPDQNIYPVLYGNRTYTIYGVIDHPQDFDLLLQGKGAQYWINAKQRVSFRHARKGGMRLERDFAQQLAYLCYRDYLKREDPFFLAKAEQLLQPHAIPCAAR